MPVPNIEALNRQISDAGAQWVAAKTPYSGLYGVTQSTEALGLALRPEDVYQEMLTTRLNEATMFTAPPALPASIDWRNNRGDFVTPVRDQNRCGSCVAFATVASVESRALITQNRPGVDFDLSEAALFYCGAGMACNRGWQPQAALAYAQRHGLGRETDFPYTPGNQPCQQVTAVVNTGNPATAATMLARKQALLDGPAIASMAVYGDFFSYSSGIYRHVTGPLSGYHAVCVIGYDDGQGCWIVKNSWDTSWGEQGFFRIAYGECGFDSQFPFYFPDAVTLVPGTTIP
ncbi:MAG TPA: C1 family peptidase [Allosphingosinicella sp.]|jgi:C1A family cysteine protease